MTNLVYWIGFLLLNSNAPIQSTLSAFFSQSLVGFNELCFFEEWVQFCLVFSIHSLILRFPFIHILMPRCAVSLTEQSELQKSSVHRSDVDLVATLTGEDMQLPPMYTTLSPSKPVDHTRLGSPSLPSGSNQDSALNTRRLSDPGSSLRPGWFRVGAWY